MPASKKLAQVVIGANFGDEGKGLLTDYYAATPRRPLETTFVVRFNGGAQAGHTVVTPEGRRHIFSHFGSGSLVGAVTFLSRHFVVDPRFFANEYKVLALTPRVDPRAPVAIPYDRLINEVVEQARGAQRHGSVGVGINEAVRRSEQQAYRITVDDLNDRQGVSRTLYAIANEWVPFRLKQLGFPDILSRADQEILNCQAVRDRFVSEGRTFLSCTLRQSAQDLANRDYRIIFEGAQGLLLDPDYGTMPHVTPSHTGLKNVVALAKELKIEELDVTYVTRCYVTRHGAGPLPFECEKPYEGIIDATNLPHKFQGELRFAPLNIDSLKEVIAKDLKHAEGGNMPVKVTLAVTCIDQVAAGEPLRYVLNGQEASGKPSDVIELIREQLQPNKMLIATGPTRKDVTLHG